MSDHGKHNIEGEFCSYCFNSLESLQAQGKLDRCRGKGTRFMSLDEALDIKADGPRSDPFEYDIISGVTQMFNVLDEKEKFVAMRLYHGDTKRSISKQLKCSERNVFFIIKRIQKKWEECRGE